MKDTFLILFATATSLILLAVSAGPAYGQATSPRAVLVIHGGAGSIVPEGMPEERRQAYVEGLEAALRAGYRVLEAGGSSVDAVVAAVSVMEDSPLFNSGLGAVLNSEGTAELDASIMEGKFHRAGAVAAVTRVPNPIRLARAVMERTEYVLLVGEGAESFASELEMELVPPDYFRTDERVEQYERYLESRSGDTGDGGSLVPSSKPSVYGTVGAVALDKNGDLAAATSTGGRSFKKWSRVGDSPIIGAGTYADNETCAVSATGTGEFFIRGVLSYRISALMHYAGLSVQEAAASVIHGTLTSMEGDGGVIGLDRDGNVAMTFNTSGMFRGYVDEDGTTYVAMFDD